MPAVGAALGPSPSPSPDPNPSRDQKFRGGRQRETAIQSALAIVVGLYFKRRLAGLFICLVGSLGFILMAPHQVEKNRTEHPFNSVDLPLLIVQMDSLFAVEGESVKVYELSLQIESLFDKKIASGAMIIFPDSLCIKYPNYFYDRCLD